MICYNSESEEKCSHIGLSTDDKLAKRNNQRAKSNKQTSPNLHQLTVSRTVEAQRISWNWDHAKGRLADDIWLPLPGMHIAFQSTPTPP